MKKLDLIVTRGDGTPLPDQEQALQDFKELCLQRSIDKKSALLPCPKCRCSDLEGSPYPADRFGGWTIGCGNPECDMYLTSGEKDTLCTVWNLVYR